MSFRIFSASVHDLLSFILRKTQVLKEESKFNEESNLKKHKNGKEGGGWGWECWAILY